MNGVLKTSLTCDTHPFQAEGVDAPFLKAQQFLLFSCRYNNMGF